MNTWITAQNLAFRYDNETVFTDIHFAVEHGGFTLIVGPNGAGKTTLLRLLAGRRPRERLRLPANRRKLGNAPAVSVSCLSITIKIRHHFPRR